MKNKLLLILILTIFSKSYAQSAEDIGKIQLSVIFPENIIEQYDQALLGKIESKLQQMLSEKGISASNYNNGLILEPKIIVNSKDVVEGGMQNINVYNITLQLLVKQDQSSLIFSSLSKNLKGTGRTEALALSNAVNSLSSNDPALLIFIDKAKEKINHYYTENCSRIAENAENLSKKGQYEESLALLMTVPESASCYKTAQLQALATFKNFQKKDCSMLIKQATSAKAVKDYSTSLQILNQVESTSPCASQSNILVKEMEGKISADEKRRLDIQLKLHNDEVALEKSRINAVKEIVSSYYKSKQPNIIIVK